MMDEGRPGSLGMTDDLAVRAAVAPAQNGNRVGNRMPGLDQHTALA